MLSLRVKLERAARRVRRWAARQHKPYGSRNLEGMCGIASVRLLKELRRDGFRGRIVEGEGHAYVMYRNYIVDVTASQFGWPNIVIRKARKYEPEWWHGGLQFRSAKKFIEHQKRTEWPPEQIYD